MLEQLTLFTNPSDTSCRKVKAILKEKGVSFVERHLFRDPPTEVELLEMLKLTTNGIDEILSKRSQTFKNLNVDIEELRFFEALHLLSEEPKLLRRPLLMDGEKLIIGLNREALEDLSA
ncbi:Spx/MgsR family RNA polymerase-binding regulatory protein [Ammoniphilus sp. CFH 90114]|uniref:Spx/MgsR family RNA polymerase-binding regulatory protein n=1 Tax=Ammoniphilus sp. CFH 90114 TaxID=2493665 RepID=UPI00100EDF90|nr:Spx/MgsR family RNA polymerase-binding regulatory protein [Ammoniphilus sp. CFH 90114]RXT13659.1 Spx/MgsR family RNA polymerase-binding regulatory protein [Ammoniphilus sp. CFH 90114]